MRIKLTLARPEFKDRVERRRPDAAALKAAIPDLARLSRFTPSKASMFQLPSLIGPGSSMATLVSVAGGAEAIVESAVGVTALAQADNKRIKLVTTLTVFGTLFAIICIPVVICCRTLFHR